MRPVLRHLPAFVAVMAMAPAAKAGGIAFPTFGGELGHPTTTNATAVYYNPGAITQSEGLRLFVDGTLVLRRQTYEHAGVMSDDLTVPGANEGKAELFNALVSPFLGGTYSIDDLSLGLGVYAPIGGSAAWDDNTRFRGSDYPGAVDGVQRWHNISGTLASIYATGAVAYRFADRLSVGVGINAILTDVDETRARTPNGDNDMRFEGRSHFSVSGVDWSFGIGLLLEAIEKKAWMGLSYQAAPNVTGDMKLDGTLVNSFPPSGPNEPSKVTLHQTYPDIFRLGGRYLLTDQIELRLHLDYERWSKLEEQCLAIRGSPCATDIQGVSRRPGSTILQNAKRDWQDTVLVRVGGSYFLDESRDVEIFGGLGFESNAVPDRTLEPGLTDGHKILLAGGGRFALADEIHLAAGYTHVSYLKRDTAGRSGLSVLQDATRAPDAGGEYKGFIGFLNVNLEVGF